MLRVTGQYLESKLLQLTDNDATVGVHSQATAA